MIALDNSANRMILASNIKVKVSIKKKKKLWWEGGSGSMLCSQESLGLILGPAKVPQPCQVWLPPLPKH